MKKKTIKTGSVTQRTTIAERAKLIKEYHKSGLSRRAFAQSKGINLRTFHCWFREKLTNCSPAETNAKFVKVALPEIIDSRITLVAECKYGLRIHIAGLGMREAAVFIREVGSC